MLFCRLLTEPLSIFNRSDKRLHHLSSAVECGCAEVQTHREGAVTHRDGIERLRRANLTATAQTVEERKLHIIISIRRGAAVGQSALVVEAGSLSDGGAGAKRDRQHENEPCERMFEKEL